MRIPAKFMTSAAVFSIAVACLGSAFHYRGEIWRFLHPPPDFASTYAGKVVLYSTSWCPYCKRMKLFLNKQNIPFVEKDIEKSELAWNEHRRLGGGGVPLILVSGHVVHGFDPAEVKRRYLENNTAVR